MRPVSKNLLQTLDQTGPRLRQIGESAAARRPAPGKWSKKEILGHLIDSASNNHQRFVRAQLGARLEFPPYEQDGWVRSQAYIESDWNQLIDLWLDYNRHLAAVINAIPDSKLATPCRIGEDDEVTLEFLTTDYLDHLRHHLRQIFPENA